MLNLKLQILWADITLFFHVRTRLMASEKILANIIQTLLQHCTVYQCWNAPTAQRPALVLISSDIEVLQRKKSTENISMLQKSVFFCHIKIFQPISVLQKHLHIFIYHFIYRLSTTSQTLKKKGVDIISINFFQASLPQLCLTSWIYWSSFSLSINGGAP